MRTLVIMLLAVSATGGAWAQSVSLRGAMPVGDGMLATVRGGFVSPTTGLAVSFGVERAVYVNGDAAAVQSANAAGILLVQRGVGNTFEVATAAASTGGTVVQNTLDNQAIRTVTTLDIKANSLQTWNGLNLHASVGDAITASLRR
jgi:hypothetical protein